MKSIRYDRIPADRETIYALCRAQKKNITEVLLRADVNEANYYKHLRKERAIFRWEADAICKELHCSHSDLS